MAFPTQKAQGTLEGMPAEVMAMIVNSTETDGSPVLSLEDVSNLRLVSRRIFDTSLLPVGDRFFASRKFMMSRSSLAALQALSKNSKLSFAVRELAIGSERINPGLKAYLTCRFFGRENKPRKNKNWNSRKRKMSKAHWEQDYESVWCGLIADQDSFEAEDGDITSLRESLQSLGNLRAVHLTTFEDLKASDGSSRRNAKFATFGAKSVMRQLGLFDFKRYWEGPGNVSISDCWGGDFGNRDGQEPLYRHYNRALKALNGILDRAWTLEISLSSRREWGEKRPIDLASPDWQAACHRVRSLNLSTTSRVFDQDWLNDFIRQCSGLECLTIYDDENAARFLWDFTFPKLRHLTINGEP